MLDSGGNPSASGLMAPVEAGAGEGDRSITSRAFARCDSVIDVQIPNVELLTRAASLYFLERLTQQEIARMLGVSRQTVGRLLQQAQEQGIVRIEIRSPAAESESLARKLEKRYGLVEAVVAVPDGPSEDQGRQAVGKAAARLLERRLRKGKVLGLGWSTTVLKMVEQLMPVGGRETRIVQLDGGVPYGRHPNETADIVHRAALALDARAVALMTPLYVDTSEIRDALVNDTNIGKALKLARRADLAFFGLGAVSRRSNLYATGYLSDDLIDTLLEDGAVGEILGRFFDGQGEPRGVALAERTMGLGLRDLVNVPFRCLLASGELKVAAVQGALAGRYANSVVVDEAMALALVSGEGAVTSDASEAGLSA
jgi:deoxyribonucleoside regulator